MTRHVRRKLGDKGEGRKRRKKSKKRGRGVEKVGLGASPPGTEERERETLAYVHARTRVQHDDISAIFQEVETACHAREKSDGDRFFLFFYRGWEIAPSLDCFDGLARSLPRR